MTHLFDLFLECPTERHQILDQRRGNLKRKANVVKDSGIHIPGICNCIHMVKDCVQICRVAIS